MSLPTWKLYVYNNVPVYLSLEQVLEQIKSDSPNIILSSTVNDELLETFGFERVILKVFPCPNRNKDTERYIKYRIDESPKKVENQWELWLFEYVSDMTMQAEWDKLREQRNSLLRETDWVCLSNHISVKCKDKFRTYRQLLRDCLNICTYPHQVYFPKKPDLTVSTSKPTNALKLTAEQIEKIKIFNGYQPNWNTFLTEWKLFDFNPDRLFVENLIQTYTDEDVAEIL